MSDLKPCPFCGGEAEMSYYMYGGSPSIAGFYVECSSCSAGGEPFEIQGEMPDREEYTKSKAIAAWNTRAKQSLPNEDDRLIERVARAIARATVEAAEPEKFGRLSDAGIDALVENLAVKFFPEARAAIAAITPGDSHMSKPHPIIQGVLEAHGAPTDRPWQPWERNFSGGRVGVQHHQGTDETWTVLHVESGVGRTTTSLRDHEAWDLALMLSPALKDRLEYLFAQMKRAQNALHQFKWADSLSPVLRKLANERDCGGSCEYSGGAHQCPLMEREEGCAYIEADELRQFADALEFAAELRAAITPETKGQQS